jgi:prepilin-type N-terminal cleavage/methylation domain-containing protein
MMRRNGFTLIEVMVALTLSAAVVLLAHRLLAGVLDGTQRGATARTALDREMNARRWLVEAFGSLDIGGSPGTATGFVGRRQSVEFTAWQRASSGSLVRTRMTLACSGDTLWLRGMHSIPLVMSARAVDLDYLLEPGASAVWVREWISPVSAPLAVRLRIDRGSAVDTLLFLVGPRG